MPKLTESFVKGLPAPDGSARIHMDDKTPGFGVRVTPNGFKAYVLRYRNAHGAERKVAIGPVGVWSLDGARDEAKRLLQQVHSGVDPQAEREAVRAELTVNEIIDRYLKSAKFEAKADSTRTVDKGRFERHVRPLLGKRIASDLTLDQVQRTFADIRDGKTAAGRVKTKARGVARVMGGEGTARAAIRLFRAMLSWAVKERLLTANPALGAEIGKDGTRQLLLTPDQYVAMFTALDRLEDEGRVKRRTADAIRVIALTGARRGEVIGLRRDHLSAMGDAIVLPTSRHKTGRITGEERVITLPEVAREIVARQSNGDVIFPIDTAEITKAWALVRAAAGLPSDFGLHGLRHSVASHLAMGGAQASEIMQALGHRQMSTSQKYVHWAQDNRQRLAERAASVALAGMRR